MAASHTRPDNIRQLPIILCDRCANGRHPHLWYTWSLIDGRTVTLCNFCAADPDKLDPHQP